jgi:DNA-binding Lrp family transcriptional regulator
MKLQYSSHFWEKAIKKKIEKQDVELLNWLTKNQKWTQHDIIECGQTLKLGLGEIKQRLKKLKQLKILIQEKSAIINPLPLWDHFLFSLVKAKIHPPVVGIDIRYPRAWTEMIERLQKTEKEVKVAFSIREVYALIGTEWDILVVSVTNDLENFQKFFEILVKQGWIDKVWTFQPAEMKEKWIFNPIKVPSPSEYKAYVEEPLKSFSKQKRKKKDSR